MKVKIGNKYYDSKDQPIMLVLTDKEKEDITNMPVVCTRYAVIDDNELFHTNTEFLDWMNT